VGDPGDVPASGVTAVVRQLLCAPETGSGRPAMIMVTRCYRGGTPSTDQAADLDAYAAELRRSNAELEPNPAP
jgi:hypothetical protein